MGSRPDDIRKRIARRKRERDRLTQTVAHSRLLLPEMEETHGFDRIPTYESGKEDVLHPLFRKEVFIFKILASTILVFLIAIIFRNNDARLESVRQFVSINMEKEFQFTTVANWYENQFGKPLALLPFTNSETDTETEESQPYALPASGKILEKFGEDGQKVTIETAKGASVTALSGGMIEFAGVKEGFGKTVIVQHADKSETWYGNLDDISVNLYEYIEKGNEIGKAMDSEDGSKGSFYLALKEGNEFIDPFQVIQVE
jgi:stage IV sporulation protein FA